MIEFLHIVRKQFNDNLSESMKYIIVIFLNSETALHLHFELRRKANAYQCAGSGTSRIT